MQIALPCAHVDLELQRNVFAEMQAPVVFRVPDVHGPRILRHSELTYCLRHAVLHARLVVRIAETKISLQQIRRTAIDGELPSTHLQFRTCRFSSLWLDNFCCVFCAKNSASPARISAAMPD